MDNRREVVRVCENCKWFYKRNGEEGECRKHSATRGKDNFPLVSNNTWCGQYKTIIQLEMEMQK